MILAVLQSTINSVIDEKYSLRVKHNGKWTDIAIGLNDGFIYTDSLSLQTEINKTVLARSIKDFILKVYTIRNYNIPYSVHRGTTNLPESKVLSWSAKAKAFLLPQYIVQDNLGYWYTNEVFKLFSKNRQALESLKVDTVSFQSFNELCLLGNTYYAFNKDSLYRVIDLSTGKLTYNSNITDKILAKVGLFDH